MPCLKANGKRVNGKGSGWLPRWRRIAIYIRDQFTCAYCGKNLAKASPRDVTLDHLTCQVNGGSHHESNLVTACLSCNSRRQHMSWVSFTKLVNPGLAPDLIARVRRVRRHVLNRDLAKDLLARRQSNTGGTR